MSNRTLYSNINSPFKPHSSPMTVEKLQSNNEGEDSPLVFAPNESFSFAPISLEPKQPESQVKLARPAEEAKENVLLETSESLNRLSSTKTYDLLDNSLSEQSNQEEAFSLKSSLDHNAKKRIPLPSQLITEVPKHNAGCPGSALDKLYNLSMNPFQEGVTEKPRIFNDYHNFEELGRGSFGEVYKCTNKLDGKEYAVKVMKREFYGRFMLYSLSEAKAMAMIANIADHIHVVRYYNSWEDNNNFFIAMEYCPSSLTEEKKKLRVLDEEKLKEIFKDVCLGLQFLHQNNVVHLDVKPENILISQLGRYKLGDMGQAQRVGDPPFPVGEGDSRYLATEVLHDGKNCDLTKVDIFSLGMTFFELVTEIEIPKNGELWHQLRNENFSELEKKTNISEEFKGLIKLMMSKDPKKRPSASELLQRLSPQKKYRLSPKEKDPELKWEKFAKNFLENEKESLERKVAAKDKEKERRRKSIY